MTSDELSLQISAVQSEKDRLELLFSEYIGDNVLVQKERNVKSHKEGMWNLIDDLTDAFSRSNPLTHELFSYSKEMKSEGLKGFFNHMT